MKKTRLINRAEVRRTALSLSARERNGRFTRVSESFYRDAEAFLLVWIRGRVHSHRSVGKTLTGD